MTSSVERAAWWVVAVVGVASLVLAGLAFWAVSDAMNWGQLFGGLDWNPGSLTTAPPTPSGPPVPEIMPPGAPLPGPTPPG